LRGLRYKYSAPIGAFASYRREISGSESPGRVVRRGTETSVRATIMWPFENRTARVARACLSTCVPRVRERPNMVRRRRESKIGLNKSVFRSVPRVRGCLKRNAYLLRTARVLITLTRMIHAMRGVTAYKTINDTYDGVSPKSNFGPFSFLSLSVGLSPTARIL